QVGQGHPAARELAHQALEAGVVLLRDAGDGRVQLLLADLDAGSARAGDLQLRQDQALEHLALEVFARRELVLAAGELAVDVAQRAVELATQDDVLVHDGDDAVERLELLGRGLRQREEPGKGKEAGKQSGHGVGSGEWASPSGSGATSEGGTRYRSSR